MPKPKSKSESSKPQESFLSTPHVEVVEVKREPSPQEVLSSVLEKLKGGEQLVLKSEELSSGRINVPSLYSGEAEVFVIDARSYEKTREKSRDILVVVRPLSEKVLVHFNMRWYIFVDKKWETLE